MVAACARAALSCGAKRLLSMPVGCAGCYPVICFRLYLTVVAIGQEFFYKFSVNLNEHKEMVCRVFNPGFREKFAYGAWSTLQRSAYYFSGKMRYAAAQSTFWC